MQLYRWRARSMAGKLYQGSYLADSKQEVAAFLHENYDYITGIEEVQSFTIKISRLFNSGKVNDKERSRFFQQLAAMIGSGIPLCRALELLKTRCPVSLTNVCCLLIGDLHTGHFTEVQLIRSPQELQAFRSRYGISADCPIEKIY